MQVVIRVPVVGPRLDSMHERNAAKALLYMTGALLHFLPHKACKVEVAALISTLNSNCIET